MSLELRVKIFKTREKRYKNKIKWKREQILSVYILIILISKIVIYFSVDEKYMFVPLKILEAILIHM